MKTNTWQKLQDPPTAFLEWAGPDMTYLWFNAEATRLLGIKSEARMSLFRDPNRPDPALGLALNDSGTKVQIRPMDLSSRMRNALLNELQNEFGDITFTIEVAAEGLPFNWLLKPIEVDGQDILCWRRARDLVRVVCELYSKHGIPVLSQHIEQMGKTKEGRSRMEDIIKCLSATPEESKKAWAKVAKRARENVDI